ncbi:MAG: hypothetical protein NC037_00610 [Bacteroides sp.]|nr:hypothetical protein [Bacillota bacterium]MCM1393562.1 hypothetical protein [[Eubacterium] siraeum]MCM1455019.1 hypothetical protein [Bacteroides sp.]
MILFFTRGEVDSDAFIKFGYSNYRDLIGDEDLPRSVQIIREQGKKPRFDCDDVYFNLSHSHGVTMLGVSHAPIGVDIEKIRPIDFKKFDFIAADSEEEFFEKWTERESYLKFTGEGLGAFRCEIPADVHFEHFPIYDGYHACVCAEEQNIRAYDIDPSAID